MDLAAFQALLTPTGQSALAQAAAIAPTEETFLPYLQRLQKDYPAGLAKAALETAILRGKAAAKFALAAHMYFTREALEQASSERVSRYRAERFAGLTHVADLGCGIGGDTLGLASVAPAVTGVDRDPLRLAMAAQNLAAYGLRAAWREADLAALPWPGAEGFFFDPARRAAGRRKFSVQHYEPPLSQALAWLAHTPAGGVKISPGVDLAELAGYDAEIEFISERGELKECAMWFGPLRTAARRATLLARGPEGASTHTLLADPAAPQEAGPPLAYLYEPDPAVLRAGLVTTLAAQLGARQLDREIAYLTAGTLTPTPFARAYAIEEALPFQLKRLRERLRALRVGTVTVKKRGSPLEPAALIQQLRLAGPEERIVFLTQVEGKPWALIGQPAG